MATFFDDASLVMIPSGIKESKLYSIKPTDGSGDFTFSRGTDTATRVNASGLIEKERGNQLLQSNQFSNASWLKEIGASVTSGQSGYDGTNNAWLLNTDGTQYARLRQTLSSSGVKTFSLYAKAGTLDWIGLYNGGGTGSAFFDLSNGVTGNIGSGAINASIISIGGGWYRCEYAFSESITDIRIYLTGANGTFTTTAGNIYIQDAQLEQGLVATDYIETTTAAVYEGITDNLPRLDYSGGASCPSLLLEPSRTNTLARSEYPSTSTFILVNGGYTWIYNQINSPEGLQNAAKWAANGTGGIVGCYANISVTSGNSYSFSVYAKAGDHNFIQLQNGGAGSKSNTYTNFDLVNGTKSDGADVDSSFIEPIGNDGWYRCGISFSVTSTGTSNVSIDIVDDLTATRNGTFTGSIGDYFYAWGFQLEAGSYPTSYIPTYGTSASRAKDTINQNIQTITSGLTEGTLFIEFEKPNTGENNDLMRLRGSGTLGRAYIYNNGLGFAADWGTSQNFTIGENTKGAWRLDSLSSGVEFLNGVKGSGASGTAWSDIRILRFNADGNGGVLKIKKILFFPTALTDAECITLTTL